MYLIYNSLETIGMVERKISKNFSVEDDIILVELVNKSGIADSKGSYSSIDPGDPKSAEGAFFLSSVNESIFHGTLYGVFSHCIHF